MLPYESVKYVEDDGRLLVAQPQHDDAGVVLGPVCAQVSKSDVERDEQPLFASADVEQRGVGRAGQTLVGDGVDLVACGPQRGFGGDRDVLVEFDLHVPCDSVWISCLASQAPYAAAARTSSSVTVG